MGRRAVTARPAHVFICGDPALDLTCTLRARRTERVETLDAPDRLDAWFLQSGLADVVTPAETADLNQAVALREAVYRLVSARLGGERYDDRALALVNETARKAPVMPKLTAKGGRWVEATPAQVLSTLARHAIELLTGPDAPLLKECADAECTKIFIDRSRGGRREWCGMDSCGNKIKAAAYRARRREAGLR
ncbi:hypothetical protein FXF51_55305 [Nonomuraea sp. PA05]|uniref:CGNR zinc finger domain-containing protein n=1 Tax=Nonomuraea sp. PA05 TaxID=2604466 RepID=UPI0011D948B8|nr:CGNR zinc finger domain-containing protein [Nonomuraea sp. PA05]TYB50783.1 hypothetical protein FXF51_55305 [Nonomuraea sp. PA05]